MNIEQSTRAAYFWLLRFIQLQLFITVVSLPILISWGLPVSLLSPIGNLIFSPILALFLFLSCLIFFCEIFYIPNGWFIAALESLTAGWLKILSLPDKRWLVGFSEPNIVVLLFVPALAFVVLMHKKTSTLYGSIACFVVLLVSVALYSHLSRSKNRHLPVACNAGQVHVVQSSDLVTVVDPGYIGQRASGTSWVQYTLVPAIIKQTGKTVIDHLILLQPGTFLFQAIAQLTRCITIKNIYLVCWDGTMKKSGLRAYYALKEVAQKNNINLVRFGTESIQVIDRADMSMSIVPLKKQIKKQDFSYQVCSVRMQIDNNDITFYPAQYNHQENVCLPAQEKKE